MGQPTFRYLENHYCFVLTVERGFAASLRTGRAARPDAQSRLRCFAPNSFSLKRIMGKGVEAARLRKADRPSPLMRRARAAPAHLRCAVRRVSEIETVIEAFDDRLTAYLLYNGSAT
jgi:hypothetical protein